MTQTEDPFAPADGEKARWRHCWDIIDGEGREPGDQVLLQEVMERCNCDAKAAWAAMRDARRHLEEAGRRTVRTVPKFGWVVMNASEHLTASDHHAHKARRQVSTAHLKVSSARRKELTQFEREAADRMTTRYQALSELMGRRRSTLSDLSQRPQHKRLPPGETA